MPVSHYASTALISILSSTSYLLSHYGYNLRNPSLTELQEIIGRAIGNIKSTQTERVPEPINFESLEVQ